MNNRIITLTALELACIDLVEHSQFHEMNVPCRLGWDDCKFEYGDSKCAKDETFVCWQLYYLDKAREEWNE